MSSSFQAYLIVADRRDNVGPGLTGGPTLARVFSAAIVLVAAIIIFRTLRGI